MSQATSGPLPLTADIQAAGAARAHVNGFVADEGIPDEVADAVLLVVSELVTNAVLHGLPPITICLQTDRTSIRVEVCDGSAALPQPRAYGPGAVTGRGLRLVTALTSAWGVDVADDKKSVWADLPFDRAVVGDALHVPPPRDDHGWAWPDAAQEGTVLVRFRVPARAFLEHQEHSDAIHREAELLLLSQGFSEPDDDPPPAELLDTLREVNTMLSDPPRNIRADAQRALERGDSHFEWRLLGSTEIAAGMRHYIEKLAAVDEFARRGLLLVEPASKAVAALRAWFVTEIERQLAAAKGRA